jgi:hypothetical protein
VKTTFRCTVCGFTLFNGSGIAQVQSGDTTILTATVVINGNTYTDERTVSPLTLGENTVYLENDNSIFYQFIPSEDGEYRFYSMGEYDPNISIYDVNGNPIGKNDDHDFTNYNFDLTVSLEGGTDYIIMIDTFKHNVTAPMTMFIEKDGLQYDINSDGVEDINDIGFILSASVGNIEMNWAQALKADLNNDGAVDGFDAAWLDRYCY